MKKLTNVLAVLSIGVLLAPALESCKKGDEDPGLSLRSRKGRVAGEWNVSSYEETTSYTQNSSTFIGPSTNSSSSNGTVKVTYDGENFTSENITNSSSGGSTSVKIVAPGEFKYSFKKDGTFTVTQTKVYEETEKEETNTYALETVTKNDINITIKGTWNFVMGVNNDVKNKQFIVLTFLEEDNKTKINKEDKLTIKSSGQTNTTTTVTEVSENSTYETKEISQTWELIRLANKELKALARGKVSKNTSTSTNITNSNGGNPYQESSVTNRIEESVIRITLEQ
jgi:hypothetical protein